VEYEVEGQRFTLNPGDSLIFAAQLRHRWRNASSPPATVLIILSGFEQGEHPSEFHLSSGKKEPESDEQAKDVSEENEM
jgi:quercetin dioxygenase-like cupin family protein